MRRGTGVSPSAGDRAVSEGQGSVSVLRGPAQVGVGGCSTWAGLAVRTEALGCGDFSGNFKDSLELELL